MAHLPPPSNLVFNVRRRDHELLTPSRQTPSDYKPLSDIDNQDALRFHVPMIHFYGPDLSRRGKDPVNLIRQALRDTLVYYYPFAGRLRETPTGKVAVDCNGEGIIFIEADANITLQELGHDLQPPYPCFDELLHDVPGSSNITDSPLLLVQVTRLRCGGFIFASRVNHTVCDGYGRVQFLTAVGEMARGASEPSVLPVWSREILNARIPPRVTSLHHEFDVVKDPTLGFAIEDMPMSYKSFFFGQEEIQSLKMHLPTPLQQCTTFEIMAACLWKCRVAAIEADSDEEVRFGSFANLRRIIPLPAGYYGNAFAHFGTVARAREVYSRPLEYTVELVRKAKELVNEEYVRSQVDFLGIRNGATIAMSRPYFVSDLRHVGLANVDFGAGKRVFGGVLIGSMRASISSFLQPMITNEGRTGVVTPICLPSSLMDRFVKELSLMLRMNKFR